jgi:oligosaccharyl transferase (archaeosortase A-associated)
MVLKKIPVWLTVVLVLAIIMIAALWLRMVLPHDQVFVKDWIKLTGVDTYYMMRLADNLLAHFPNLTQFDPYNVFPEGARTDNEPNFFVYLLGGIIWLVGLGKPDQHFADVIAVYIPPVLAALTILATFFIGKALKNVWTGLLAAGLLAVMPGEFLNRSLLGYTDYHIAESMFSAFFIMFTMFAINSSRGVDVSLLRERGLRHIWKPMIYAAVAGLSLALYMLTWAGAALFILIVFVFIAVQIILDYPKANGVYATGAVGLITFLVALIVYYPGGRSYFSFLAVIGAIALVLALTVVASMMGRRKIRTAYFILTLAVCGLAGLGLMLIAVPDTVTTMFANLSRIFNWNVGTTIMEMQPLLIQNGSFSFVAALGNYTSGLFLGIAGLALVIYHQIRKTEPAGLLLIIWSILILLSTLAMRRFSYYFAVNIGVLSGYFLWWILGLVGFGREKAAPEVRPAQVRRKAQRMRQSRELRSAERSPVFMGSVLTIVLFVIVYPNLGPLPGWGKPSIDLATRPLFAPSDAWCESLDWVRVNTPEPLGDPMAYYKLYGDPASPGGYVNPKNAYGVLAWWDYGYWITRMGRRIPFSNPGTSATRGEAKFFMAQDEAAAAQFLKDINIHYVIVDDEIASYEAKFFALPTWIGGSYENYYDVYLQKQGQNYTPSILFYPEYYRTMVVRLYNFNGGAVTPTEVNVIGYETVTANDGKQYKSITEVQKFNTYPEAVQFLAGQKPGTHRIVGGDPYLSPVPLEALKRFKLIHNSPQTKTDGQVTVPFIKVFEYQP